MIHRSTLLSEKRYAGKFSVRSHRPSDDEHKRWFAEHEHGVANPKNETVYPLKFLNIPSIIVCSPPESNRNCSELAPPKLRIRHLVCLCRDYFWLVDGQRIDLLDAWALKNSRSQFALL